MRSPYLTTLEKPPITILLASPRGFCAGVDRAIQTVEQSLKRFGAPVYVRHEIVHNRYVVESLEDQGAVFVDDLDEVPEGAPVIFSAHGVPKSVPIEAKKRNLFYLDATCPLVSKVHRDAERHYEAGRHVILIGHAGHPEVIGTMGQLPHGSTTLIETALDAQNIAPDNPHNLAYITQTTLSLDETSFIISILKKRFPDIHAPHKQDICYATTNRQEAVKAIASRCDYLIIIGAPNSSNSLRLVEVAVANGCPQATLTERADDIDWKSLKGSQTIGISAGASAPETLVDEVISEFKKKFHVILEPVFTRHEDISFKLPNALIHASD